MEQPFTRRDWGVALLAALFSLVGSGFMLLAYSYVVVRPLNRALHREIRESGYPKTMNDIRLRIAVEDSARFVDQNMPTLQP